MSGKSFRVAMFGLVGLVLTVPFGGCDSVESQPKATIDTTTPIKAPSAPSTSHVEVKGK